MKKTLVYVRLGFLAVLTIIVAAMMAEATIIATNPGDDTFDFRKAANGKHATDFDVNLVFSPVGQVIDFVASHGGPPFPNKIGVPLAITYIGPPGIPPGGLYKHRFPCPPWAPGTRFDVYFSVADGALGDVREEPVEYTLVDSTLAEGWTLPECLPSAVEGAPWSRIKTLFR
jgi:hypothetical protein